VQIGDKRDDAGAEREALHVHTNSLRGMRGLNAGGDDFQCQECRAAIPESARS
jgi:hypothetical protein